MAFETPPDGSTSLTRDQKLRAKALDCALWIAPSSEEENADPMDISDVLSAAAKFEAYLRFGTAD